MSSLVSLIVNAMPRPLDQILTDPSLIHRNTPEELFSDESLNAAFRMILNTSRIATASLIAYGFYKINPTNLSDKGTLILTGAVLSLPSTMLAGAGYCFYQTAVKAAAAWGSKSPKAAGMAALCLTGGYLLSNFHIAIPYRLTSKKVGLLDTYAMRPFANNNCLSLAQGIASIKSFLFKA